MRYGVVGTGRGMVYGLGDRGRGYGIRGRRYK